MGALVTENDELAKTARVLKDNGRLARRVHESFRFSGLHAMNLKTTEFSAAIACAQVEKRFEIYEKRKRLYDLLYEELSARCVSIGLVKRSDETVPMAFPMILPSKGSCISLVRHLRKRRIETRNLFGLMSQVYDREPARLYPTCAKIANRGIYLGCHQHMTEKDANYVVRRIAKVVG
jgi:dTDP-4-amino-4,6-dideoxygalactose transaminase